MSRSVIVNFFSASFHDLINSKRKWWFLYLLFLAINFVATYLELNSNNDGNIVYYQLITVIIFILLSGITTIHFMQRFEATNFSRDQFLFGSITYFLYTILYYFFTLIGAVLLILPFFFFGTFFILAPLVALRENNGNAFKRSFYYVKKRPSIAVLLFLGLVLPEFMSFLANLFAAGSFIFYLSSGVLSIIEASISFFVLKLIVDFYYGIRENPGAFEHEIIS